MAKHKAMGRNKEEEYERDKRKMRMGLIGLTISLFTWSLGVIILQSTDFWGTFIRTYHIENIWYRFLWTVPALFFVYVMYKAWDIKLKQDNA